MINKILGRQSSQLGGWDLEHLNLSLNRLGCGGFAAITHQLLTNLDFDNLTLNVSYNEIEEVRLLLVLDASTDRIFNVTNLVLDGNIFQQKSYIKISNLLSRAHMLTELSLVKCQLGNEGLTQTFDAI